MESEEPTAKVAAPATASTLPLGGYTFLILVSQRMAATYRTNFQHGRKACPMDPADEKIQIQIQKPSNCRYELNLNKRGMTLNGGWRRALPP